jgi:hypothetical protein
VEVEVATPTLLSLAQAAIEMSEELQDPLLTSAIARSRVLDGEGMDTAILTSDLQSAVAHAYSSDEINIWHEPIDADKVLVLVLVLQILSRNLDLVELLETELT